MPSLQLGGECTQVMDYNLCTSGLRGQSLQVPLYVAVTLACVDSTFGGTYNYIASVVWL